MGEYSTRSIVYTQDLKITVSFHSKRSPGSTFLSSHGDNRFSELFSFKLKREVTTSVLCIVRLKAYVAEIAFSIVEKYVCLG